MKTKWLFLPIETEVREWDAKLLIANEAAKHGYSVVFGSRKMIKFLNYFPKGILLYKDSEALVYDIFKRYRDRGGYVAVHDEEGFVQFNDADYIDTRLDFLTLKEIDLYLCWGSHQQNVIDNFKAKYNSNLVTENVGHPRIDLLRSNNSEQNQKLEVHNKILINTKLSAFNIIDKDKGNTFIKLLEAHKMIKSKDDLAFYNGYIEYEKKLFYLYVELIKSIASSMKTKKIMIRPHPSEDARVWIDLLKEYSNVVVEKSNSVHHWISESDLIIHTGCTTGIESVIMGKYTIAYIPFVDDRYKIDLPNQVSHSKAYKNRDVLEYIQTFYNSPKSYINNYNADLFYYLNIEQKPSYVNIVDKLDSLNSKKDSMRAIGKLFFSLRRYINKKKVYNSRKVKYYNKERFVKYFGELLVQYNIKSNYKNIQELDINLFLIQPKNSNE